MTCIVGLVHAGAVTIGGDSAAVDGLDLRVRADAKVFRTGAFICGFTSSFRMGQLLRYALTPPDHDPRIAVHQFMATTFVDAVRTCLKAGGYAEMTNGAEQGGSFLVGYRGQLFEIASDYQVGQPLDGFAAIGCAGQVALGALFATRGNDDPAARVQIALEAAERFSTGVRAPFVIERLAPHPDDAKDDKADAA